MTSIDLFFPDLNQFAHSEIFDNIERVWDPLKKLGETIARLLREKSGEAQHHPSLEEMIFSARGETGLHITRFVELTAPVFLEKPGILIGGGTLLEPTAILKGPAVIGCDCEIRQGAYIRGHVIVGDHSVIGHATEVKNSIVMNHTEAGHFNYIGDSILGSYVNLGAGSRLANLQFRTAEEKQDGFIRPIEILIDRQPIETKMEKLGAILGDHVEIGCNSVLCPGSLIGKNSWVYPNTTLPKGYFPPHSIIGPQNRKPKSR